MNLMNFIKKLGLSFVFLVFCFSLSAYKFPEKLPAPLDFDTYTFDRIKFGQTSVNEFAYLAPNYEKPETEGVYTIYSETNLDNIYKSLRAGFKDNFLDWIELEFAVPQSWNKFKKNYGNPQSVNTEYSKKFNYHDYGFFNVVTDKNNAVVFGVTLYGESDFNPAIKQIVSKLPDYKNFNFINEFIPGQLMENDFNTKYQNFNPTYTTSETDKKTYSVPAKYLKYNNYYSAADLVFSNGILMFINLKPKNLNINDVKKIYGDGSTQNAPKTNIMFLEYPNFIITYNKETLKVLNVGILGAN